MKSTYSGSNTSQAGFSVVEVLIAMVIFLIGILPIVAMQVSSMSRSGSTVKSNQAGFYAVDLAENLLKLPYDDSNLDTVDSLTALKQQAEGPYTVTWAVFDENMNTNTINSLPAAIVNNAIFSLSNKAQVLGNIPPNTKIVMVNVTHPLGENARLTFIKPNI